jgi:hypothetical protein
MRGLVITVLSVLVFPAIIVLVTMLDTLWNYHGDRDLQFFATVISAVICIAMFTWLLLVTIVRQARSAKILTSDLVCIVAVGVLTFVANLLHMYPKYQIFTGLCAVMVATICLLLRHRPQRIH